MSDIRRQPNIENWCVENTSHNKNSTPHFKSKMHINSKEVFSQIVIYSMKLELKGCGTKRLWD